MCGIFVPVVAEQVARTFMMKFIKMQNLPSRAYLYLSTALVVAAGFYLQQNKRPSILEKENISKGNAELDESVGSDHGQQLYLTHCSACHGEQAQGNRSEMAGALASMPRWYLLEQLQKFRSGLRGAHPKDIHGQRMMAVARGLDLEDLLEVVDYLEIVPPIAQKSTQGGDLEWGRELFDVNCAMCHRYNAHGMIGFKSAPLNGQQDWYLLAQMDKFDKRIRGYHKDDVSGHKMLIELDATPSTRDRLAILAYISSLSEAYPVTKDQQR